MNAACIRAKKIKRSAMDYFFHSGLILILCIAILRDFIFFKIDNILPVLIIIWYLLYMALTLKPQNFTLTPFLISGTALAAGFLLMAFKIWGGGDSKLLAALLLWIPLKDICDFILIVTVLGGFIGILEYYFQDETSNIRSRIIKYLIRHNILKNKKISRPKKSKTSFQKTPVPYGVAIGLAGCFMVAL